MFEPLPTVPDHPALEREILELWERERTFERLRERNAGGPRFSFMDGPITANNPMGVHHAWGRTLKDVFQRYKALHGYDQRYQNGFDCQGLWVEVEVEKELGLNSKREIEEYGLAEFAERCKERVAHYAGVMTEQSKRLGMWMDWGNDYYTFSDTNIEYIWRFLKECHARGWLYKGHRSTQWCPRCGTSLSQHEQAGEENYRELEHPSLYVRFPLRDREGEALVSGRRRRGRCPPTSRPRSSRTPSTGSTRRRAGALASATGTASSTRPSGARSSSGSSTRGRSTTFRRRRASTTASSRGTRSRSTRAPASSTSRPARRRGLRALARARPAGADADRRVGPLAARLRRVRGPARPTRRRAGHRVAARARPARRGRARSSTATRSAGAARRRSSSASSTTGSSAPRRSGSRCSTPTRRSSGRRRSTRSAWTTGCATWATGTSRASATSGCRCRSTRATCGELNVIGSRAELEERATGGLERLQELHRPWIDEVPIRCEECGEEVRAHPRGRRRLARRGHRPLLDARLAEPRVDARRLRDRRAAGPDRRRPARPRLLGEVVPGRLGLGDARADPALVLLVSLHGDHARRAGCRTARVLDLREGATTRTAARCTSRGGTRSS